MADKSGHPQIHVLQIDYSGYAAAGKLGARWDTEWQVCTYIGNPLPIELAAFAPRAFSYEAYVERSLNKQTPTLQPEDSTPGKDRHVLRPHQAEAMKEALKAYESKLPGFLFADEVGLGKTDAAWETVLRLPGRKILIVCPLGVIPVWRETLLRQGTGNKEVIILNYDRLKKLIRVEDRTKVKSLKGVARFGEALAFDVVIFDESHRLKNMTSARFKLAHEVGKKADFHLWLSATAGQNPLELGYLSSLLAARTGDSIKDISKDFEGWCSKRGLGISRGKFGKWDYIESKESCEKVQRLLFIPQKGIVGAVRRTPRDIAGWPEIQRIPFPVELTPDQLNLYKLEWNQFLLALRGEAKKVGKEKASRSINGLAAITRFRQKAGRLRVESTTNKIIELLENGRQVAVSCQYLMNVEEIEEALLKEKVECLTFTGAVSPADREVNRVAYQKGEVPVMLFTSMEGFNLHQGEYPGRGGNVPRAQIDHDLRWSAIEMNQIDGRSHRNGQFAPVFWSFAKDTIEERVAEVMLLKLNSMQTLHGDARVPEIDALLQSLI
ncbi:MAG: Helicase, family [Chthoniobacteraceae bacterium]|nr:Helicase, family [Chthoniobacteraceae bacterium]